MNPSKVANVFLAAGEVVDKSKGLAWSMSQVGLAAAIERLEAELADATEPPPNFKLEAG